MKGVLLFYLKSVEETVKYLPTGKEIKDYRTRGNGGP